MERLVNELKKIAEEKGISPKQIAKRTMMNDRTVYYLWNQTRIPHFNTLEEIAFTLGYEIDIRKKG